MKYLVAIWLFSTFTFALTFYVGRLSNTQFAILGFGGMLGVAWSAYLVTDPAAARAVVALLAAIPAIAAMGSSRRVTVSFTLFAMVLALLLSSVNATSGVALVVAGGAAVTTVFVPVFMVAALRQSLGSVLRKVAKLGDTDPLTGVLNRRGLLSRNSDLLDRIARTRQSIGFMMMDFDNFKFVNDNHGHAAGDSVLIAAAAVIEETVPPRSIISRFGGEEFVVMTESADPAELVHLAEQVRSRIQTECGVTISIGAIYAPLIRSATGRPNIDEVIDFLTRQADRCMYAAKDAGRNKVISRTCAPIVWVPGPPNEPQIEFVADERRVGSLDLVRRRKAASRDQAANPLVDDQTF
ncbi:GGDEF domain-containing protein [Nocardia sp. 348MFTsu5.1]|uniref:GGDEF domain-containing protein n=1 Tax=Nocardia sp. 348MFTsu5.1 TaxID=1172185 RepID=UPI0012DEF398|nr:GGDEF domain-containing protein [Nocardia sp. 348MFTsu5.1]